jgi:hypothetical protein
MTDSPMLRMTNKLEEVQEANEDLNEDLKDVTLSKKRTKSKKDEADRRQYSAKLQKDNTRLRNAAEDAFDREERDFGSAKKKAREDLGHFDSHWSPDVKKKRG